MSVAKNILKTGIAAGAATFGVGALVYEGALNTTLLQIFKKVFNKEAPEQTALYASDYYTGAVKWFTENKGGDRVIHDEKAGNAHAYVFYADKPTNKWAVLPHGYSSSPEGTSVFAREYHNMGFNLVAVSMRGFANDEANYCSMGWHDKDIVMAWINWIVLQDPDAEILIHGYSMGAATTMLVTGERDLPKNVKCAVSDCGFTTVYEQYQYVLKHNASIPAFPLLDAANVISKLRNNFDFKKTAPIEAIKHSTTPTIFCHGTADDFVPYFMLDKLYDACTAEKAKFSIEGGLHATSSVKDSEFYWKNVKEFIGKYI